MVKKGIPPVLMNWAWERDNKESGMVPHFPSLDHQAALRKRQKKGLWKLSSKGMPWNSMHSFLRGLIEVKIEKEEK